MVAKCRKELLGVAKPAVLKSRPEARAGTNREAFEVGSDDGGNRPIGFDHRKMGAVDGVSLILPTDCGVGPGVTNRFPIVPLDLTRLSAKASPDPFRYGRGDRVSD
jgi:hypothetical protein